MVVMIVGATRIVMRLAQKGAQLRILSQFGLEPQGGAPALSQFGPATLLHVARCIRAGLSLRF